MSQWGWQQAEGRRRHRAPSSPRVGWAGGAGRSTARGWTAESRSRAPLPAALAAQPSGRRGSAPPNRRLQKGGDNPARLNFVPFNTRVITTSGNLPPTQLCARINWKRIITITNNSLLAFIASKAWRNSHRRFPHHHLPSDVCSHRGSPHHEGRCSEERGPQPPALRAMPKFSPPHLISHGGTWQRQLCFPANRPGAGKSWASRDRQVKPRELGPTALCPGVPSPLPGSQRCPALALTARRSGGCRPHGPGRRPLRHAGSPGGSRLWGSDTRGMKPREEEQGCSSPKPA